MKMMIMITSSVSSQAKEKFSGLEKTSCSFKAVK